MSAATLVLLITPKDTLLYHFWDSYESNYERLYLQHCYNIDRISIKSCFFLTSQYTIYYI